MRITRTFTLVAALAVVASSCLGRVSVDPNGDDANGTSFDGSLSANGRYLVFASYASNLVSDDTNETGDIFVRDLWTARTTRVSVSSSGVESDQPSWDPEISADGMRVVFWTSATNLVDGEVGTVTGAYLHDRSDGSTIRLARPAGGGMPDDGTYQAAISADGATVAFASAASDLVAGDTNERSDIFTYDVASGAIERVSLSDDEQQSDNGSTSPSLSADGRLVAFTSYGENLVVGDTNGQNDIFVRDRDAGATTRVSVSSSGQQLTDVNGANAPMISGSGRYVVFFSDDAGLVDDDTNNTADVFRHDRDTGTTARVSTTSDGSQGLHYSARSSISDDGSMVAFESFSTFDLAITSAVSDIFVKNMDTGELFWATDPDVAPGPNGASYEPGISGDGQWVAFDTAATQLKNEPDTNGANDVYVWLNTD